MFLMLILNLIERTLTNICGSIEQSNNNDGAFKAFVYISESDIRKMKLKTQVESNTFTHSIKL